MGKGRLETFSDGVIAIIITIMVLELKAPRGVGFESLGPLIPIFLSYVLSFVYVGIYWNNHHHTAFGKDHKGLGSIAIYAAGIALSFVKPAIALTLYVVVACIWVIPDRHSGSAYRGPAQALTRCGRTLRANL